MSGSPSDTRRLFTAVHTRRARGSVESVMKLVLDPSTWALWQPEIEIARGPAPIREGDVVEGRARMLGFTGVDGRSTAVHVTDSIFEEDVVVGVRMKITYEVRPRADGVEVTRRLTAHLPGGLWGRVLSMFLKRRLEKMQSSVLEALTAQAEAPSG